MSGWVKIHRKLGCHWVFKDAEFLKAWLSVLLYVNYSEEKVLIKNQLFVCKRGESLRSLDSWAKIFGRSWDKSKTRRFFKLLEKDKMIETQSERITTRLKVCNYDDYQADANADETQMKHKRNASETQATPNKKLKKLRMVMSVVWH